MKNIIEWLWFKYVATEEEKQALKSIRLWNEYKLLTKDMDGVSDCLKGKPRLRKIKK